MLKKWEDEAQVNLFILLYCIFSRERRLHFEIPAYINSQDGKTIIGLFVPWMQVPAVSGILTDMTTGARNKIQSQTIAPNY